MTLATMQNNLMRFAPGLNPDLVKSTIQDSYRQLCSRDWSRLKLQRQITTVDAYTTGTCSISTGGIVTGSGTTFTSSMEGSFFRATGYSDSFFEIQTFSSITSITLRNWAGVAVAAGSSYTIFKTIYAVDSLFGIVWDLEYQTQLIKKSQSYFNRIDPARLGTGDSPLYWAYAGTTTAGVIQVELYPVPSAAVPVRVYGKIKASTLGDSDSPYLPEDLIEAHALISCYKLKELQQPKMGWEQRLAVHMDAENPSSYPALLAVYSDEDDQLDSHHQRVRDTMEDPLFPPDDNFALSHEVD